MSSNPFLRPKEQRSNNDQNKNEKYNSSNNSFTKSYNNNSISNDTRSQNGFSKENRSFKSKDKAPIKTNEFILSEDLFPMLAPIVATKQISTNFKDALNYKNNVDDTENNKLKSGWIEIYKSNNNIIFNEGEPTPYKIKKQQIEKLKDDPNFMMNKAINRIQIKWDRYRKMYDSIYGEGSYDDLYYLPPIYGSEYDNIEYDSLTEEEFDEDTHGENEIVDDLYH